MNIQRRVDSSSARKIRQQIHTLTPAERKRFLNSLTPQELEAAKFEWALWARFKQLWPEIVWRIWLLLAGRGWGKTRTGAENTRYAVESLGYRRIHVVGATSADVRDVMIEGESGILSISPPWFRPKYEPSKRRLTWPNGAVAQLFSADEPDRLRGPQCDFAWCDETAAWRYRDAWDQLMFGLRLGDDPRCIVTTTPRPTSLIKELAESDMTYVTVGSTYENRENLADAFYDQIIRKYEGTRMGRQELNAEILTDIPGALWTWEMIEQAREFERSVIPAMKRVVVAIDPAVSSAEGSDETGIIVCGLGDDDRGYVIHDASGRYSPDGWAREAVRCYRHHRADRIVAERNNGGDLVESTIRTVDQSVSFKPVWASRGKRARAEPVAALYEQGRVTHTTAFPELEEQLCTWTQEMSSPDRLDALVWALTNLMIDKEDDIFFGSVGTFQFDGDRFHYSPPKKRREI